MNKLHQEMIGSPVFDDDLCERCLQVCICRHLFYYVRNIVVDDMT